MTALEIAIPCDALLQTNLDSKLEIILGKPGQNGSELCRVKIKYLFGTTIAASISDFGRWAWTGDGFFLKYLDNR